MWLKNRFYQKLSTTKDVLLNCYSLKKKNEKDSDNFWKHNNLYCHNERPSGDNFVAEFDEEVPKIDDSKEGQNLPPPNYEIATEQFKATCHYCDKIYHSEESLKMHLISHRIELNEWKPKFYNIV